MHLEVASRAAASYADILTPDLRAALYALAPFDDERKALMDARLERRRQRSRDRQPIGFLDPSTSIPGTAITVQQARDGQFAGGGIPACLERQWIQGTGPAARPRSSIAQSIRNVAYALLS